MSKYLLTVLTATFLISSCAEKKETQVNTTPLPQTEPSSTPTPTPTSTASTGEKLECQYQWSASKLCLNWSWEVAPKTRQYAKLKFRTFTLNKDDTINDQDPEGTVRVFLWMPGMGHGSKATLTTLSTPGHYSTEQVWFSMGGDWEIRFQILKEGKIDDEVIVPYSL
jgi:hypothetical protein